MSVRWSVTLSCPRPGGRRPRSTVRKRRSKVLPNGHYVIKNYHGGTPFPNPQEPHKGWKILANVFWGYVPSVYVNSPNNYGSVWSNDRFGNSNTTTLDVVYRWSDFNTDPGFPVK